VPAVAKLKEHQIMCAEELIKHQSVRKTASVFNVDESTLRYHLERKRENALDGRALQPEACAEHESVILDWIGCSITVMWFTWMGAVTGSGRWNAVPAL
jgi:hypothetical protein